MQRKAERKEPAERCEAGWPSLPADPLSPPHRGSGPFQGPGLKREHALVGNRAVQGFSALTGEVAGMGTCAWGDLGGRKQGRKRKCFLSLQLGLGLKQVWLGGSEQTGVKLPGSV